MVGFNFAVHNGVGVRAQDAASGTITTLCHNDT